MLGEENLKIMRHWCYWALLKAKNWAPEWKEREGRWGGHSGLATLAENIPRHGNSTVSGLFIAVAQSVKGEKKYSFEKCLVPFPQKWSPWPCSRSWTGNGCWRLSQPSSQSLTTCWTLPTLIVSTTASLNAWPSYFLFVMFYVVYGYTCMYILTCMRVNIKI